MGKKENYIEGYIFDEVKKAGGICWKFTSGITGVPDRVVILNGHTVFVELKAPDGAPSKMQLVRAAQIAHAGGQSLIIDTRQDVDRLIEKLLAEPPSTSPALQPPRCQQAPVLSPEGFCPDHGWDCQDYALCLDDQQS